MESLSTHGGFTVGHNATVGFTKAIATIVALREVDGRLMVTVAFNEPQPVDVPEGATATRFELGATSIRSTWKPIELTPEDQFNYQLLARLRQDCEYYLGFGGRNKKHLWALDEAEQIQKMKALYAELPEKPTWLSLADIEKYEAAMLRDHA